MDFQALSPDNRQDTRINPALTGVSETMLWSLYNRAAEAGRTNGILTDPDGLRIQQAIDYDFGKNFGDPAGSLAMRAAAIDATLRDWLAQHPDGLIVSLGEGLETQSRRVDNGRMRWLSVDLPAAIRLREQFLPATDRFRHLAVSALDPAWMDAVDPSNGVFIVAQGLLMYLQPEQVRGLLCAVADRFPGAGMVFDAVPRWFSQLTLLGLHQTPHYRLPPMPWGIDRDEIAVTLRRWHKGLGAVAFLDYHAPRGWPGMLRHVPFAAQAAPCLVRIEITQEPLRIKLMTSDLHDGADTFGNVMTAASATAGRSGDLALAAGQIVSKRMALGVAAALDPLAADHAEFGRMVPEKLEAFSAAGMIMLQQSGTAHLRIARLASDAVANTAHAALEIAVSRSPAALLRAQGRYAVEWFNQVASGCAAMGLLALDVQNAAMTPICEAVAANVERLGG
jgi:O-methyltransferase involved in polyketide biosynthesis